MTTALETLLRWTETAPPVEGASRMWQIAQSEGTRVVGEGIREIEVRRALATWTLRQRSTSEHGIDAIGLRELVRSLHELPPSRTIQQLGLVHGRDTGIMFFDPVADRTLGVVIVTQSAEDEARSWKSFEEANAPRPRKRTRSVQQLSHTA